MLRDQRNWFRRQFVTAVMAANPGAYSVESAIELADNVLAGIEAHEEKVLG